MKKAIETKLKHEYKKNLSSGQSGDKDDQLTPKIVDT